MIKLAPNQFAIRTFVTPDTPPDLVRKGQRERENVKRKLRRLRRTPEQIAAEREYHRRYRQARAEHEKKRKATWRKKNRHEVNAYFRRYDELTPGRREYKARKAREYRARDKALEVIA